MAADLRTTTGRHAGNYPPGLPFFSPVLDATRGVAGISGTPTALIEQGRDVRRADISRPLPRLACRWWPVYLWN